MGATEIEVTPYLKKNLKKKSQKKKEIQKWHSVATAMETAKSVSKPL